MKAVSIMMIAAAAFALAALSSGAAENLVRNGGFSQVGEDGKASDWRYGKGVSIEKEADAAFARISNTAPGGYASIKQIFDLKPEWESLTLGFRMRVNKLDEKTAAKPGDVPRAMLVFFNSAGEAQYRPFCHLADSTGGKWFERWETMPVPPDSKTAELVFDMSAAVGEFDISDVRLFATNDKCIPLAALDLAGGFDHRRTLRTNSPPNWIVSYDQQTKDNPEIALKDEDGMRFLRVRNGSPEKDVFAENFFALDPSWKKVRISAKMRTKDLKCGSEVYHDARVMLIFTDSKGQKVGGYGEVPFAKADQDWKEMSAVREVPEGAAGIRLQPGIYHSTGTVDFDDIRATPEN